MGMGGYSEKKYSEETAKSIDDEVRRILDEAHTKAKAIILEHRDHVELMTQMLMEFETLDAEDVRKIISNEWTVDDKRDRLKRADELHKKAAVTPPPPPPDIVPFLCPLQLLRHKAKDLKNVETNLEAGISRNPEWNSQRIPILVTSFALGTWKFIYSHYG